MNLRICSTCGRIWLYDNEKMIFCHGTTGESLGKVILQLKQADLLHHGKLK